MARDYAKRCQPTASLNQLSWDNDEKRELEAKQRLGNGCSLFQ
jgi:hypothetical protein